MSSFRNNHAGNYYNEEPLNNQLQDLDMELEILKRQREIIKQKQRGSGMMNQRQNNYNQPSSSYGNVDLNQHFNVNTNFNKPNKKGNKRPAERSWQEAPAPKQSNSRQINPWQNQLYNVTSYYTPQPLLSVQLDPFARPKAKNTPKQKAAPRTRPDFKPFKANKNKKTPPNKLNTYPPQEAKKLVSETLGQQKPAKTPYSNQKLLPNVEPTHQMKGRLELALGQILKELRQSRDIGEDVQERLRGNYVQREVKKIIRERITNVMMNKVVGNFNEIVACYRKKYPKEFDEELIKRIKEIKVQSTYSRLIINPLGTSESVDIHLFFKSKIDKLLKEKMQEMIFNLSKIYGDNEDEILKCIDEIPEIDELINKYEDKINQSNDGTENANDEQETNDKDKQEHNEKENQQENEEEYTEQMNCKENAEVKVDNEDSVPAETPKDEEENSENVVEVKEDDLVEIDEKNEMPDADKNRLSEEEKIKVKRAKIKKLYKIMDLLIENRIPKLLAKFKDEFAKVMYCEKDFILAKEMIMIELKEKLRKSLHAINPVKTNTQDESETQQDNNQEPIVIDDEQNNSSQNTSGEEKKESSGNVDVKATGETRQAKLPLYVMLLGRPSLPVKTVIYEFLTKFNPSSIKKHKTVNNLLVIGFNNKDDYDNILAANESKVGDSTFIIKANEVITEKPNNATETKENESNENKDGNTEEINEEPSNDETVIQEETVNKEEIVNKEETDVNNDENTNHVQTLEADKKEDISTIVECDEEDDVQIIENNADTIEIHDSNITKNVKESGRSTPTRTSTRLASVTPSTIKTRRASRLAQNQLE